MPLRVRLNALLGGALQRRALELADATTSCGVPRSATAGPEAWMAPWSSRTLPPQRAAVAIKGKTACASLIDLPDATMRPAKRSSACAAVVPKRDMGSSAVFPWDA
jgi:hypothetical protein